MHRNSPGGIMLGAQRWRKRELARRRNSYVGRREHRIGPPFHGGQSNGDLKAMDEIMAPDYVNHTELVPGQQPRPEGEKRAIAQFSAAFSKSSVQFEDQVAAGDKVVSRCILHRTHDLGKFMGVAPTGREMTLLVIVIHRISGGKVAEEWGVGTIRSTLRGQLLEQERIDRERVEQDLRVARSIQQASLPKEVPTLEGWQISPFYRPAREVGGGFYDFFELRDGHLGIVVGDATGKGVPAALVMASARSMLRAVAQASDSPGEALRRVNDPLATDIPPNMFVTCFYAILEPKSGSLTYANAGHDLPYLHRDGAAEELRARGMPL